MNARKPDTSTMLSGNSLALSCKTASIRSALRIETNLSSEMGIPSYFKRLADSVKGILVREIGEVKALLLDFNCIVYNCIRDPALPAYCEEKKAEWEKLVQEEVCKYIVEIWQSCGKPASVLIAVDGVVPMAKIRQQRMRRFKSLWWATKECEMGIRKVQDERWDTNAITPGTAFMETLSARLHTLAKARGWTVSDSDEPGEGEHKVMAWIRSRGGATVVYGLDADLILLSMLHRCGMDESLYLMREKAEFYDSGAACKFMYLSIDSLLDALFVKEYRRRHVLDYIAGMSFLGNDFLPHGISFKIKEGGHERLLSMLGLLHGESKWLVDEEGVLIASSFNQIVGGLAATEEEDTRHAMKKKRVQKQGPPRSESEKAMLPVQNLPHDWFVEKCLGTEVQLVDGWRDVYRKWTPVRAASYYRYGHQWILDYYMGRAVNTNWYFPWHLPPLMSDVLVNTEEMPTLATDAPPRPQEQLALVLPMESWHLVRDRSLRELPTKIPQMWPSRFGFFSAGKRWMWECEADVPIFTPGRLRNFVPLPALTSSAKLQ